MSRTQLLRAYGIEAKFEAVRLARMPSFWVPRIAMPVCLYLLFGALTNGGPVSTEAATLAFINWGVYAVVGPGLFIGLLVASERSHGLLTFKRASPMAPSAYVGAKIAVAGLFSVTLLIAFSGIAMGIGGVQLGFWHVVEIGFVLVAGVAPACAISLWLGSWAPPASAPSLVNAAYVSMVLFGDLFVPLPARFAAARVLWPTYHLSQLARASAGLPSVGAPLVHASVLAGITLVLAALATHRIGNVE